MRLRSPTLLFGTLALSLLGPLSIAGPAAAASEELCASTLKRAQRAYHEGQIAVAQNVLMGCHSCFAEEQRCVAPEQCEERSIEGEAGKTKSDNAKPGKASCVPDTAYGLDLQKGIPAAIGAEAYRLVALIALARGDEERASVAMERLLDNDANARSTADEPLDFAEMLARTRDERARHQVQTVSKIAEDRRASPATVEIITAEQMLARGYPDIEAALHDLPGIDISRGNGLNYANVYLRGLRTESTDRVMFLVDGIEQNELHTNVAYISRQFPLIDIERIEIVYGPASTIYGANAFAGVINIVTRRPGALLKGGETLGVHVQGGYGRFRSRYGETNITLGTRDRELLFSTTARWYLSEEADLSANADWDYRVDAEQLDLSYDSATWGSTATAQQESLDAAACADAGPMPTPEALCLRLTPEAQRRARQLDRQGLEQLEKAGYSDFTNDWYLSSKLVIAKDFEVGAMYWSRLEGTAGWYTDRSTPGASGDRESILGGVWGPRALFAYLRFDRELGHGFSIHVAGKYAEHDLHEQSRLFSLYTYGRPGANAEPGASPSRLDPELLESGQLAGFYGTVFQRHSNQLRGEIYGTYQRRSVLSALVGAEIRLARIQGEYDKPLTMVTPDEVYDPACVGRDQTTIEQTEACSAAGQEVSGGTIEPDIGEQFRRNEFGGYTQLTIKSIPRVWLVAGARYDLGWGPRGVVFGRAGVLSPKTAAIYVGPDRRIYAKLIYTRAFVNPSNWQRYSTSSTRTLDNPDLGIERVSNVEASFSWFPKSGIKARVASYYAHYRDIVREAEFAAGSQFINRDTSHVFGVHSSAEAQLKWLSFYGNYSFTRSLSADTATDPDNVEFEDTANIAAHRATLGTSLRTRRAFLADLRVNLIAPRHYLRVSGTQRERTEIPFQAALSAALTYRPFGGQVWLQLSGRAYLNPNPVDPGVRESSLYARRLPQPQWTGFLRAGAQFGGGVQDAKSKR